QHMRKLFIGFALATSMLANPAMARDGSVYAGIEGGVLFGDSLDVDFDADGDEIIGDDEVDLFTLDTDRGWDVDGVLGYDFGNFRLEAEAGYKTADVDRLESSAGFDLDPSTPAVDTGFDVDGDISIKSLMVNALADFGPDDGAQFYVGGGFGRAWANLDGAVAEVGPFIDDSDSSWAWQLIAGARFAVSQNVDLGLKYRYFNVGGLDFVSPDTD